MQNERPTKKFFVFIVDIMTKSYYLYNNNTIVYDNDGKEIYKRVKANV